MTLYLYPAGMPNSSHTYTSCASASVSEAARCPEARACNSSTDLQPCVYAGAPLLRLPLAPAFATAGLPPPSGPTGIPTANDLCLVTRGSQATGPFLPNPSPNAHIPNLSRPPYTSHPALHTTPTLPHTPLTTHPTPPTHHTPAPSWPRQQSAPSCARAARYSLSHSSATRPCAIATEVTWAAVVRSLRPQHCTHTCSPSHVQSLHSLYMCEACIRYTCAKPAFVIHVQSLHSLYMCEACIRYTCAKPAFVIHVRSLYSSPCACTCTCVIAQGCLTARARTASPPWLSTRGARMRSPQREVCYGGGTSTREASLPRRCTRTACPSARWRSTPTVAPRSRHP